MKSTDKLPENYREIMKIDLQKNKKQAITVNVIATGIAVLFAVIGCLIVPIGELFKMEPLYDYFLRFGAIALGSVLYIILHEAVHGIFMKRYCTAKVRYGFTGMYAYAGSDGYYCRREYVIIALAPIVIWGIVLALLNLFTSPAWFWVVYFIQITNLSGAGGDIYVSYLMSRLPKDILVNDTGVSMTVFAPAVNETEGE